MTERNTSGVQRIAAPFPDLLAASRTHRREHGCDAYSFEDGAGLAALCARFRPERVLELGTALGYTACCLASGHSGAQIDTIEVDPIHCALARRHFVEAGLERRIRLHEGDFEAVLPTLPGPYGFAFFDGFAPTPALAASVMAKLAPGGVFVCSNMTLVSPTEAAQLKALFAERSTWRPLAPLEGGATPAWARL